MSWDFKAKFSDMPPEGIDIQQEQLGAVPLRGDWCFSLNGEADDLVIEVKHGGLPHAALGNRVMVRGAMSYFANGAPRLFYAVALPVRGAQPRLDTEGSPFCAYTFPLSKSRLADEGKLPRALQNSLQQYRVSITLTQEPEGNVTRLCHTSTPDLTRALQLANLSHSPHMDVRLLFKRVDDLDLELWTTADFLEKASEYHKILFASGSTETVTRRRSKRQRGPSVTSEQKPPICAAGSDPKVDWEDSDDETDAVLVERDWMSCTTTKQDTAEFDYRQIEVRETAYSTMCAVLLYLQSGHIDFAPIRSSRALSQDELTTKCEASLAKSLKKQPTLPPPVSPKSVYRLAHLLEREELQKLALDSFASSLTINGAASELFSPASLAYDKLRKVVVDFVVKNWKEVEATEAWHTARAKVASGQTEGGAQILLDLLAGVGSTRDAT